MLTAITIENFKGISEPVRLELRPITLLFGMNSAGKSSLLHALMYAREVFERHNLDPDRTISAGDALQLGGFLSLVHQHDRDRGIRLRFDMELGGIDLPMRAERLVGGVLPAMTQTLLENLSSKAADVWVQVLIAWSDDRGGPYVAAYEVGLNGQKIGEITCLEAGTAYVALSGFNHQHPDLQYYCGDGTGPSFIQFYLEEAGDRVITTRQDDVAVLIGQTDALPRFDALLALATPLADDEEWAEPSTVGFVRLMSDEALAGAGKEARQAAAFGALTCLLDALFVGPGLLLREALKQFRYLGPQRQVPPRGFVPARTALPERWASGLAGWDLLYEYPPLVDKISRLLADKDRMNLGYTLDLVEFREFEASNPLLTAVQGNRLDDLPNPAAYLKFAKVIRRLLLRPTESPDVYLEPADLGVGVGQMIPVLAAALDDRPLGSASLPAQLVAVEHPELNLHPRLQAELADIFLEGALSEATRGRIFFIETHSEVLPLRLFRRVRECTRNTAVGAGDGRGDGSGAGYGDGSGDGRGDGSGAGHGDGSGDGRGDGSGAGYGDGRGDGHGGGRFDFTVKPLDVGVWYVDRSTGVVTVRNIEIDINGDPIIPWPDELFEIDFYERFSNAR